MTDTAMHVEMRALAARTVSPLVVYADADFMYWWTKERARADAEDALPRGADRRQRKRAGNRAFKKTVPDWRPTHAPIGDIDRSTNRWWQNRVEPGA